MSGWDRRKAIVLSIEQERDEKCCARGKEEVNAITFLTFPEENWIISRLCSSLYPERRDNPCRNRIFCGDNTRTWDCIQNIVTKAELCNERAQDVLLTTLCFCVFQVRHRESTWKRRFFKYVKNSIFLSEEKQVPFRSHRARPNFFLFPRLTQFLHLTINFEYVYSPLWDILGNQS